MLSQSIRQREAIWEGTYLSSLPIIIRRVLR